MVAELLANVAFFDGPFDPKVEPWLLSNQRKLGIAIQGDDLVYGYWPQPHGYLRGSGRAVLGMMTEPKSINNGGAQMGKSITRRIVESESK